MIPELPRNIDAERAVLGSILLNRDAITPIAAWFTAEMCYMERHAQIYAAMLACYSRREPPDIRIVYEELRRRGLLDAIGGIEYLSDLSDAVPTSAHVEYYARIVERAALDRRMITAGGKIAALGYDQERDAETKRGDALKLIDMLIPASQRGGFLSAAQAAELEYRRLEVAQRGELPTSGARTGLRDLDEILMGLCDKDFLIVAARPSVSKTALLLDLAHGVVTKNADRDALVFSLEMGEEQIRHRMLSKLSGIDTMRIRSLHFNDADEARYMAALGAYDRLRIFVDDTPALSVAQVRDRALRHQAEHQRPVVLFVDYVQLISLPGSKADRVQQMSEVSRSLKALPKELDCPLVAASQLSRAVEGRQSHVPMLSDLRETGSWEQDADIVLFIYREELYDKETDRRGIAEIHIAKHRNGPIGVVPLHFDACTTTFRDMTYRTTEHNDVYLDHHSD